jgi:hypothetical protein
MSVYIPNSGEKEALKAILMQQGVILGLYKNQVSPDGNMTYDTLEEMPTGGGRGYAPKVLPTAVAEGEAGVLDKWIISLDSSGKAQALFSNVSQDWVFQDADVADGNTVRGAFGYFLILPFDAGAKEIKVGDTVKGATSGATGIVTAVNVTSGLWSAGTAAGDAYIKTKSGTFVDGENLIVLGEIGTIAAVPTVGGTGYSVSDIVEIVTGGAGALAVVTTVDAGVVTGLVIVTGGAGYAIGAGKATEKVTGGGDDALTVEITALASAAYAVTNTGAVGDALKKLMFVEALSTAILVNTLGQIVGYTPKLSMSTT